MLYNVYTDKLVDSSLHRGSSMLFLFYIAYCNCSFSRVYYAALQGYPEDVRMVYYADTTTLIDCFLGLGSAVLFLFYTAHCSFSRGKISAASGLSWRCSHILPCLCKYGGLLFSRLWILGAVSALYGASRYSCYSGPTGVLIRRQCAVRSALACASFAALLLVSLVTTLVTTGDSLQRSWRLVSARDDSS